MIIIKKKLVSFLKLKNNIQLKNQSINYIKYYFSNNKIEKPQNKNLKPLLLNARVLCLVPHADDEYIGCINTLSDSSISNVGIVYYGYTGKSNNVISVRLKELQNLVKNKGFKLFYNKQTRELNTEERVKWLRSVIENFKPTIILSPSYIDWHSEHRSVALDLMYIAQICKDVDNIIYCYHISVPHSPLLPIYYYGVCRSKSKTKFQKFQSFYPSQSSINPYRFELQERIDAKIISPQHYAIETYIHSTSYLELIRKMKKIDVKCLNDLYMDIRHIGNIRKSIEAVIVNYEFAFDNK